MSIEKRKFDYVRGRKVKVEEDPVAIKVKEVQGQNFKLALTACSRLVRAHTLKHQTLPESPVRRNTHQASTRHLSILNSQKNVYQVQKSLKEAFLFFRKLPT